MPALKEERVVAKLWECIQRRFKQKGVQWDRAKSIPIAYNDESATIKLLVKGEADPEKH